ncbi:asparagine synthase-related protein [Saliphagus sp. LR7]|uniref:asparagine synthase-related protein n=1 Tax=Saliphagus sp. LR7 TaxID=2282654 RepID=UPI000DF7C483|nr:asparagine synthase-related protein [Saliphagus sp. LR7]
MSDLHGTVGADAPGVFDDWIGVGGTVHEADGLSIAAGSRYPRDRSPGTDERTCWVLGELYGHDAGAAHTDGSGGPGGSETVGPSRAYEPRPASVASANYALALYDRYGRSFVCGLNGNFLLAIHDPERGQLLLSTDRFGTVPLYWTRPDDGTAVFSTNVQTLPYHPAVDTAFHPGYLHEYLAFRRTFGVRTPLEGVEKLRPGTVTTMDLADGTVSADQYWRPRYRPCEVPFERFVDEFVGRFRAVLDEWLREDREYGVLLSGGSDSRLALAGLCDAGADATAFHMNDWMNREARTAERVAMETGTPFEWLRRGPGYRIGATERNRWATTFNGWFSQPYTSGFEAEITGRVDGLLSGLYGDSLFRGYGVPSPTVPLGGLGSVTLPVERPVDSIDGYVDLLVERAHDGYDLPTELRSVLDEEIHRDGGKIRHHGVVYDSLDDLVYYGGCYPLSNDDDVRFQTGLRKLRPYRTPYLDNRLLELSLSMPVGYRLRRNVIDRAVARLAPDLAEIAHASTGVALSRPFPVKYAGEHLTELRRKCDSTRAPPEPYLTQGPWLDDAELLRSSRFVTEVLTENRALADAVPGMSAGEVRRLYDEHCNGENHVGELYTLVTLLTMPATARVLAGDPGTPDRTSSAEPPVRPPRRVIADD